MRRETRLNFICGGILLASLGFLLAWETTNSFDVDAPAIHAGTGLQAPVSAMQQTFSTSLAGSVVMFLVGVGLTLFALLHDRRLK